MTLTPLSLHIRLLNNGYIVTLGCGNEDMELGLVALTDHSRIQTFTTVAFAMRVKMVSIISLCSKHKCHTASFFLSDIRHMERIKEE
jgi:hypothetical protein